MNNAIEQTAAETASTSEMHDDAVAFHKCRGIEMLEAKNILAAKAHNEAQKLHDIASQMSERSPMLRNARHLAQMASIQARQAEILLEG